jgi:hypothetical protein
MEIEYFSSFPILSGIAKKDSKEQFTQRTPTILYCTALSIKSADKQIS